MKLPAMLEGLELRRMLAATPGDVSASALGRTHGITVKWADVAGEAGYTVQRSTDGVNWSGVGSTAADVTSFSDTGLAENTPYRYRVLSESSTGPSAPSPAATATTAKFRILESTAFIGEPSPIAPGVERLNIVTPGQLYNTKGKLVPQKVKDVALAAKKLGQVLVIDVEHWPIDNRYSTTAEIDASIAEIQRVVSILRKTAPSVKFGFFDMNPTSPPADVSNATEMARWKASNDYAQSRMPESDYYFPRVYQQSYDWLNGLEWARFMEPKMQEAGRFNKPVYPFLFMYDINMNNLLSQGEFQFELATARKFSDGAVIWGGWTAWEPNAPWLKGTKDVQAQTSAPLSAPTNLAINGEGARLSWDPVPAGVDGVIVEKSTDGTNFSRAGIAFSDQNSWSDPLINSASSPSYRLRAYNGFNTSEPGPVSSTAITRKALLVNQSESRESENRDSRYLHHTTSGNGGWLQFKSVNFGSGEGVNQLQLRMMVPPENVGQILNVRLDGVDGPIVGSAKLTPTGIYADRSYTVGTDHVTGMHDLYLTFSGGFGATQVDYWQFTLNQPPAMPISLKTGSTAQGVNLRWTDLAGDETHYLIQRSSDRTNYHTVATLAPDTASYLDQNFPSTGRYDYRVLAVNDHGSSDPTNTNGGRFGPVNAYEKREAESGDEYSGNVVEGNLVSLSYTSWIRFFGVDFGESGAGSFDVNIALARMAAGNYLDIRLDSPDGPIVGSLLTVATGPNKSRNGKPDGWHIFKVESTLVSGATGVHDLYLVSRSLSSLGLIDWFQFNPAAAPATITAPKTSVSLATTDASQVLQGDDEDDLDLE
jgi:hypothetical protein